MKVPKIPRWSENALPAVNPWWQPPRLRNAEVDGEDRHPTWLELFFDLVLVAAIGQLGKGLSHDLSWHGVARFVALAIPIWWAWTGVAFYTTRFDTDDLSDRIFYFLEMLGVAALAVTVQDAFGAYSAGFAMSYAFLRLLLVGQYMLAAYFVPESRVLTTRYAVGFGLAAALFLISIALPLPLRFWVWLVAMVVDIGFPLTAGKLHAQLPPHNAHISERYGLFIIVVLGEAVMGAVAGVSARPHWALLSGLSGVSGLFITFSLWWVYFDHASSAPIRAVRETGRIFLYQVWLYAHLPLMIALSAMGVAIQQVVLAPQTQPLQPMLKWILCLSVALSLLVIGLIHATSCYCGARLILRLWLPYALAITTILLLAFFLPYGLKPYCWSLILAGICLYNLVIQVYYDRNIFNAPCNL